MAAFTSLLLALALWSTSLIQAFGIVKLIPACDTRRGLTTAQVKLCYTYGKHMVYVLDGSRLALQECKKQFAGRRWNCTFPLQRLNPFLHPPMPLATTESAFIHSIVAAGTMYTISRACMESKLSEHCFCSHEKRPNDLPNTHLWRGCSDNLPYGYKFSKKFVDSAEVINQDDLSSITKVLMNLHNNEAGRWAVFEKSRIQCRCHGVSKNCATKNCHRQLSDFKEVGKRLQQLHGGGVQVHLQQHGEDKGTEMQLVETNQEYEKATPKDLVYVRDSPSYCTKNMSIGSFGTNDRKCEKNEKSLNGCGVLCCGRGHHTKREIVKEKCGCKFIWCCEVRCKVCEKEQNVHYCK